MWLVCFQTKEGDKMNKIGKVLKSLVPLLIYLAVSIVVPAVLTTVKIASFSAAHAGDFDAVMDYSSSIASDSAFLQSAIIGVQVISFIIFALIYFAGMKMKINTISGHFTVKSFFIIVCGFAAFEVVVSCVLEGVGAIAPSVLENYAQMMSKAGLGDLTVLSTIATLVGAPIAEEICFRGITVKWANAFTKKFWVVNIFQALLFGIAHLNLIQGIYAFILGLALGYVANKYKSLWASILGHVVFNFAGTYLVTLIFGNSDSIFTPVYFIALVLAVAVLVAVAFFINKDKTYVEPVVETPVSKMAETVSEDFK